MARTYKYTVLTAVPDPRRGERVNIGLVVFLPDRLDIRFKHASQKLRALTGKTWDYRVAKVQQLLTDLYNTSTSASRVIEQFNAVEPFIRPSSLGFLSAFNEDDYEIKVGEILATLVGAPPRERGERRQSRINTEIAAHFRQSKLLAKSSEGIDAGKVVRDYPIAPSEGLTADFALRNGKMHITSTLDLRRVGAPLAEAALKSIVLDKSEEIFTGRVKTICVYATDPETKDQHMRHVELLKDYSHSAFDWSNSDEQWKFKKNIYDAARHVGKIWIGGLDLN